MSADDRWLTQTILHDPEQPDVMGNCWQTCIASLLGLPLDQVPHFVQEHESMTEVEDATQAWLAGRGLAMVRVGIMWLDQHPDQLSMLEGRSPRDVAHVVIGRGIETLHDPHPSRAGLSTKTAGWVFVPVDPSVALVPRDELAAFMAAHARAVELTTPGEVDPEPGSIARARSHMLATAHRLARAIEAAA